MLTGSVLVRVEIITEVYVPNVFSPNGDEHNPTFYIQSSEGTGFYSMTIFNRWGEKLFYQENIALDDANGGWDGRYKDKLLNPGVYVYMIEVNLGGDETIKLSGDILLLR